MFRKAVFLVLTILFAMSIPMARGQGTTPNMGLSLPARGTLNWDVQMRANFSTLDLYYGYLTPTFQGPWDMSKSYHKGQQVSYLGNLYSSIAEDGNNLNNIPSSSPLFWLLMISGGGVSSVGLAVPGEFNVTGSPVTGSGGFTLTKTTQVAGTFWGGPCAGIPATSGFRVLCPTDIPNITESQVTGLTTDLSAKAPIASPTFTGVPLSVTPSTSDNSTKIATTAFVNAEITANAPGTAPVQSVAGKTGVVTLVEGDISSLTSDLAAKATIASPALTGTPTAPTPSTGDNSTAIATSAYVKNQGYLTTAPVTSVAGRTGAIVLADGDTNLTDVTTNDASITKHGFLKKLPNNAGLFLDGTGNFSAPTGGVSGSGTTNFIPFWSSASAIDNSHLTQPDANTVELRNGANHQVFKIYSSYTNTSNNSGLSIDATDPNLGVIRIRSFNNGSGSLDMWLDACSSCGIVLSESGTAKTSFIGGLPNIFGGRFTGFGTPGFVWIGGQPINITGQTIALPATNIFINAQIGLYEIKGYLVITTAATSGSIAVNAIYTDETGSQTQVMNTLANAGLLDNKISFSGIFRSDGGVHNIQLSTTFGTVVGTPTYSIYAVCTQLMNQ